MKIKTAIAIVVATLSLGSSAVVRASQTINFDNLVPLIPVTDQYTGFGIQFSTHPLDIMPNITAGTLSQSAPNTLASAYQYNDGLISFSFLPGAGNVSFTAISVERGVTATYFNLRGQPIFVDARPPAQDNSTPVYFNYSNLGSPIGMVLLNAGTTGSPDAFGIDDVSFNLAPEPTALSLLLLGLAVFFRRQAPR